jgi:hypothetical protein
VGGGVETWAVDVKGTVEELFCLEKKLKLKGHCLEIKVTCTALIDEENATQQF